MSNEFQVFWNKIIEPTIDRCLNEADPEYIKCVNIRRKKATDYKNKLEKLYYRKRNWLKENYLPLDDSKRLDLHKLSAILCRCVIGEKPFCFNEEAAEKYLHDENVEKSKIDLAFQVDNIYINYKAAFNIAEGITFFDLNWCVRRCFDKVQQGKLFFSEKDSDKRTVVLALANKMQSVHSLKDYEKRIRHDAFYYSMIIALMKTDLLKRDFDYLHFSANMFQWQEYTKFLIVNDLIRELRIYTVNPYEIINLLQSEED